MLGTHAGTKRIATTPKSDEKNATTLEKRNVGSQGQKFLKKKGLRNDDFRVKIYYLFVCLLLVLGVVEAFILLQIPVRKFYE